MRRPWVRILLAVAAAAILVGCATMGEEALTEDSDSPIVDTIPEPTPPAQAGKAEDAAASADETPSDETGAPATTGAPELRGAETAGARESSVEFDDGSSSGAAEIAPAPRDGRPASSVRPAAQPSASGLKAGFADDNRQFNYFLGFLEEFRDLPHRPIPIQERIVIRITDREDRAVPNARVVIRSGDQDLVSGLSYSDGSFLFFPREHDPDLSQYTARINVSQRETELPFQRQGPRTVIKKLAAPRPEYRNVPLDIAFVLDTTGSMGEEIERLKTTIEIINLNLTSLSSRPRVRFGMVLYKDRGDEEYVTQVVPLTENLEQFQRALQNISADGGGDTPEDLEAALADTVRNLDWNRNGIRLGFIITDAPPHLEEYQPAYDYVQAVRDARSRGIKFFSVGTGGLDVQGEYILRQIAQYTYGKYIFLTYGESGESSGGAPGSVSHHTGANFQTDKLEAIIIRFAKEELAHLTDQPLDDDDEYFQAIKIEEEQRAETLSKLFGQTLEQLVDYSSIRMSQETPVSATPIVPNPEGLALNAEYFGDALVQALAESPAFRMVERQDLQKLLEELELQVSGLVDEANAARLGKLLGAEMLVTGTLYRKPDDYELFLKLIRVESGEILSVTKARIDPALGLADR